ncbi:MAG: sigma-70 family RNA polymerase sigma factor [Acidobacteriota bacterium]
MQATQLSQADRPFEVLLRSCREEMVRILGRYRIPQEDAEDLLQETFVALVFKWQSIRNPKAWLLSTLRNRCTLYWRKRRQDLFEAVDSALLDALASPQAPPQSRAELRHDLNIAISRLPERYQDLLRLRYGLGCKSSEVAEQMGEGSQEIRKLTTACLVALTRELRRMGLTRELLQD